MAVKNQIPQDVPAFVARKLRAVATVAESYPNLSSSVKIGNLWLKNRLAIDPMSMNYSTGSGRVVQADHRPASSLRSCHGDWRHRPVPGVGLGRAVDGERRSRRCAASRDP